MLILSSSLLLFLTWLLISAICPSAIIIVPKKRLSMLVLNLETLFHQLVYLDALNR